MNTLYRYLHDVRQRFSEQLSSGEGGDRHAGKCRSNEASFFVQSFQFTLRIQPDDQCKPHFDAFSANSGRFAAAVVFAAAFLRRCHESLIKLMSERSHLVIMSLNTKNK